LAGGGGPFSLVESFPFPPSLSLGERAYSFYYYHRMHVLDVSSLFTHSMPFLSIRGIGLLDVWFFFDNKSILTIMRLGVITFGLSSCCGHGMQCRGVLMH